MWPNPRSPRHAYWTGMVVGMLMGWFLASVWVPALCS